ncbi:MAG: hypothetical protein O7B99_05225 [Planctomycetota bacterium]|nr:hypothetical protein [Planctomycetota bacterium]
MRSKLSVLAAAVCLALPASADTLDQKLVSADARLLVHVDVEAIVKSTVFQMARDASEGEMDARIEKVRAEIGMDLLKDVKSVTIYSADPESEEFVVVARVTANIQGAIDHLSMQFPYQAIEEEGFLVHAWGEGDDRFYGWVQPPPEPGSDQVVVMSDNLRLLLHASWVVQGRLTSLAEAGPGKLQAKPAFGSFLHVSADSFSHLAGDEPASAIARLARSATLDVGEYRGALFATLNIETASDEDAINVSDVIQGVTALASLALMNQTADSPLRSLVDALDVQTRGNVVSIDFRYDVNELVRMIELFEHRDGY